MRAVRPVAQVDQLASHAQAVARSWCGTAIGRATGQPSIIGNDGGAGGGGGAHGSKSLPAFLVSSGDRRQAAAVVEYSAALAASARRRRWCRWLGRSWVERRCGRGRARRRVSVTGGQGEVMVATRAALPRQTVVGRLWCGHYISAAVDLEMPTTDSAVKGGLGGNGGGAGVNGGIGGSEVRMAALALSPANGGGIVTDETAR